MKNFGDLCKNTWKTSFMFYDKKIEKHEGIDFALLLGDII